MLARPIRHVINSPSRRILTSRKKIAKKKRERKEERKSCGEGHLPHSIIYKFSVKNMFSMGENHCSK